MRKPAALPFDIQGRSFTLSQQRDAGVPEHRAWASDLLVPSRGIRVPWGQTQDIRHTARVLTSVCEGTVCVRETAAKLWLCPLPLATQRSFLVHLSRRDGTHRPQRRGVRGHRMVLPDADVCELDGVQLTTPARTWLDLANVLPLEDLVAAADHFVCSQTSSFGHNRTALCSLADLAAQIEANAGQRGIRKARAALELARVGADSVPETKLRLALGRAFLPEPVLSYVVCTPEGREIAWPDLAFREFRVAAHYDGGHHLTAEQKESDIRRDEALAENGWTSITVTAQHIRSGGYDAAARRVRDALIRKGWSPRG